MGDICHLGTDVEPVPPIPIRVQVLSFSEPVSGKGPCHGHYSPDSPCKRIDFALCDRSRERDI